MNNCLNAFFKINSLTYINSKKTISSNCVLEKLPIGYKL